MCGNLRKFQTFQFLDIPRRLPFNYGVKLMRFAALQADCGSKIIRFSVMSLSSRLLPLSRREVCLFCCKHWQLLWLKEATKARIRIRWAPTDSFQPLKKLGDDSTCYTETIDCL